MYDCGWFWELVVLIVELVEEISLFLVVHDQQRLGAKLIHLKLIEALKILQIVSMLDPEAGGIFLDDHDHVGGEEDHQVVRKN